MKTKFILVLILSFIVCFSIASAIYYFLDEKSSIGDSLFVGFISSSVVVSLFSKFDTAERRT
ncbi:MULTISPECIES: hypothetical protein [Sphingobacterium]|uniref:hypothetical protein n=1 Tax=Sphingobacterium TaxID=28453 RepID=UPI002580C954|nr:MULTISPECIES: hypothetical protein [Sphingobacterium]